MQVDRRLLFKTFAAAGATTAAAAASDGAIRPAAPADAMGLLYDTTRCIGCKACVVACREANGTKPEASNSPGGLWDAPMDLDGQTKTVIKLYKSADGYERSFFKAQCMQCVDPACTNACMLGALKKKERGIVSYDPDLCIGCRYCQMACPFNVPKFEWAKAAPRIVKCELCRHRAAGASLTKTAGFSRYPSGHGPGCAEVCPREAVIYGTREELLAEAKGRIAAHPDRYRGYREDDPPRIFGESDGGGTQCLYLSHVPFGKLGLPDLGKEPVPEIQRTIQHGIYQGFVAPLVLYGLLGAAVFRSRRSQAAGEEPKAPGGEP